MAGRGEDPPASAFFEGEAEESGDDAPRREGDEEEEAAEDDGADLAGFVVNEDEAGGDGEGDGDSSGSDDEAAVDEEELNDDDLAVLEDAGLDIREVQRQRQKRKEGQDAGGVAKQPRLADDKDDLEAQLFGDEDDADDPAAPRAGGLGSALAAQGGTDALDFSDDDVDDFIVEDDGAAARKRRKLAASSAEGLGINEEQLQEIVDIFGDTSVLKPIDEAIMEQEPVEETQTPAFVSELPLRQEAADTQGDSPGAPAARARELPLADPAADPDLRDKLYESAADFRMETQDLPERWIQVYHAEPELLVNGVRRWTELEHECEARWIYNQIFAQEAEDRLKNQHNQRPCEKAIVEILKMLHNKFHEPIYIFTQYHWQFASVLSDQDLWRICELDQTQWQGIWLMQRRLLDWQEKLQQQQQQSLPIYIQKTLDQGVWDSKTADKSLKDAYDWFAVMHPDIAGEAKDHSSEASRMALAKKHKLDMKLGIKDSLEESVLRVFGITPEELGANLNVGYQQFMPEADLEENSALSDPEGAFRTLADGQDFKTPEVVEDVFLVYLSRLIASEPRVREYVREKFMEHCAISTFVTQSGKPVALEASRSFKRSYRAFHLVNRKLVDFERASGDDLFLEVLDLHRQGYITYEYSLVAPSPQAKWEAAYKYVLLGVDAGDLPRKKQIIHNHVNKLKKDGGAYQLVNPDANATNNWNWCKKMHPILQSIARSHETNIRMGTSGQDPETKAKNLYQFADRVFNGDHLCAFLINDPIYEALQFSYCTVQNIGDRNIVPNQPWNNFRKKVLLRALREELYPMLWAEVQAKLARLAEEVVCKAACDKLRRLIDMQPWRPTEASFRKKSEFQEEEDVDEAAAQPHQEAQDDDPLWRLEKRNRISGFNSILVVAPNVGEKTAVVTFVNSFGDPLDSRVLYTDFAKPPARPGSFMALKVLDPLCFKDNEHLKHLEHRMVFKKLLSTYEPAIILVPIMDAKAHDLRRNIKELLAEADLKDAFRVEPVVKFCDPTVPRAVAYHPRLMHEGVYRDAQAPMQRIAISAARFMQDNLAETCQLWHEDPRENGLLKLRLHRLQHVVPTKRLSRALELQIMETVGKSGVHVNRIRRSPHLSAVAAFLPGLGPRKARLFRRCLNDPVMSRKTFAAQLARFLEGQSGGDPMRSPVVANCVPFVRICPDVRDEWQVRGVPGLDRTRLSSEFYPWVAGFCKIAMEVAKGQIEELEDASDDEGARQKPMDTLSRLMRLDAAALKQVCGTVIDQFSQDWETQVGNMMDQLPSADFERFSNMIQEEIVEPFSDKRDDFEDLKDLDAFYLMIGSNEDNLSKGSIVYATVRADKEILEQTGAEEGQTAIKVMCEVAPHMTRGVFLKNYIGGGKSGYIEGCGRMFKQGEGVICRVTNIMAGDEERSTILQLSVNPDPRTWYDRYPVQDEDAPFFLPLKKENWMDVKLGPVQDSETAKQEQLKDWVRRTRNIRHSNWSNCSHDEAVEAIHCYPMGSVLFRGSKRFDVIIAMLKVYPTREGEFGPDLEAATTEASLSQPEKCFRTFEVMERAESRGTGFELARELEVDGHVYKDFDEIIARHMDPIAENLRLLREHPRFGLQSGAVADRYEVRKAMKDFSMRDRKMLHYCLILNDNLVGHGLLTWALGGQKPREDFLEVHPQGFSLWGKSFEKIGELIQWFKAVGWRNSNRMRKDFKTEWERRREEQKERRGKDAFEGMKKKPAFGGFGNVATSTTGLQTPSGQSAPGTANANWHGPEAAAPTPGGARQGGLSTPGAGLSTPGAGASGQRFDGTFTADGNRYGGMSTPQGAIPGTPMGLGGGFAQPGSRAGGLRQPQHVPTTPGGMLQRGYGPGTPSPAPVPSTPWGLMAAPSTPAAAFGGGGGQRPFVPVTPAGFVQPRTPMGLGAPGFLPGTPAGLGQPVKADDVGVKQQPVPQTPKGEY